MSAPEVDVVIPTVGRASLGELLEALTRHDGPAPGRVVVVDDRGSATGPLPLGDEPLPGLRVLRSGGRGPAAARNVGWQACGSEWVAFLDDDVLPSPTWRRDLSRDLEDAGPNIAATQGRVTVPPGDGSDWARNVGALEGAHWITADLAVRRRALVAVDGFDERFPRAYREDADLALQLLEGGWALMRGGRRVTHPVPRADRWVSVRKQAGNADDALMRRRYGSGWRRSAHAPPGRFRFHACCVGGIGALAMATILHRRRLAAAMALVSTALIGEFAWSRIRRGPRTWREVTTMLATSVLIPPVAVAQRLRGEWAVVRDRARGLAPRDRVVTRARARAVLFDRDGTLVHDVPYNGDPDAVRVMAGAPRALAHARAAGLAVAVVTNQSGIGRGLITREQVDAVNQRIEDLVGPVDFWLVCPHGADDECGCRKPAPGLVWRAAARLGVEPWHCVVIGDTAADVDAATAAGARGILVPNDATAREEVAAAREVARDLPEAVRRVCAP